MAIWIKRVSLIAVALAMTVGLTACATSKEDVIPQDGPDMQTIYDTHQRNAGAQRNLTAQRAELDRPIARGAGDLHEFTQQASNEIDQVFPLLPNPQMVLFVFPHLSTEGAPVPGYTTAFPMYAIDQYAMPGEGNRP
jgi:conjugative transfer region lipoprotein (TIGR03751 family)